MNSKKIDYIKRISFFLPILFLMGVFMIYPFISSVYYSLTQWDGISKSLYIGFDNYLRLFDEAKFWSSLKNSLFFTIANIIIINPLTMLLAVLLNSNIKGRAVLRTIYYLPAVISLIVVSYVWTIILTYDGVFNKVLGFLGLGGFAIDWLGNIQKTPFALLAVIIWGGLGVGTVFYLAGLQSIPEELYESAELDGVKPWSKFRFITFPLLMPTITVVTFFGMAGTLKMFDIPYIMTNGGPGTATITLGLLVYNQAFKDYNFGYATASGIVLFLLVVSASFLQLSLTRSREVEM